MILNSPTTDKYDFALQTLRGLESRVAQSSSLPAAPLTASVITIGNFDGVHIAHQALLKTLNEEAKKLAVPSVALTFDPHPAQVLRPGNQTTLLMPIEERIRRIQEMGVDHVVTLRFDKTIAEMPAEGFVELLASALQPKLFVIGPDTRFGKGRAGNADLLRAVGATSGFNVLPMSTVSINGEKVSSSGIRRSLEKGDVSTPRKWCNAPFEIGGHVVHGAGRGRELGFRTANVDSAWPTFPAQGVYVVECAIPNMPSHHGVANLGLRPTFEDPSVAKETLEVHLLGENVPDLYGKNLRVRFLKRLRGEMRFDSRESLVEQIRSDIAQAERIIGQERS